MASKVQFVEGGFAFFCPGCQMGHMVDTIEGQRPFWSFNGDVERPTISPSYLLSMTYGEERREIRCHSYIRDGRIEYLSDSTHHLSGQTVELPDWEGWYRDTSDT